MATLKVFAKKADRKTILEQAKLVGDYDAFVVVDAAAAATTTNAS